jgi:hypothetical protein
MSLIVSAYKKGKTRLWKEVTELHYPNNPEAALLVAFEPGYETWELENFIPILEQGQNDDEWKVWEFFKKEVVPGLVKEAKEGNRVTYLVGIDTADRCIDAATAWLLYTKGKKYGKTFSSLQEISDNTSENGWTLLYDELKKQFDALRGTGYGIMALAWTKEKETTLYDGKKYNSIELMMHNTGRKIFESQSSLICCLSDEVKILDKEGNELEENIVNKKGKEVGTKFHETEIYMHFRPTQYISIAGGRFTNLPEKMLYSAENFLKVFEDAVKGQLKKTTGSLDELKKNENIERENRVVVKEETKETIVDKEDTTETEELLKEQIDKIVIVITALQKDGVKNKPIKEACNNSNPKKLTSLEEAKKVFENLSKLAS